jgi:hypothetical protein
MPVKTKKTKVQSKPKKVVEAKSATKPASGQAKARRRVLQPMVMTARIKDRVYRSSPI